MELRRRALEAQKVELEVEKLTQDKALRPFERRKAELEAQKVKLEVEKLRQDVQVPSWMTAILQVVAGVITGVLGTLGAVWTVGRGLVGALDQSVHEKRLDFYPQLVQATEPLALYFPPQGTLDGDKCRAIGKSLRTWYFRGGGILLSVKARDDYFKLARALTRASLVAKLNVPEFPQDAEIISAEKVECYKNQLKHELNVPRVEDNWTFGGTVAQSPIAAQVAQKVKDFVFLQQLSSALRTDLSKDLRSRRRPATE